MNRQAEKKKSNTPVRPASNVETEDFLVKFDEKSAKLEEKSAMLGEKGPGNRDEEKTAMLGEKG